MNGATFELDDDPPCRRRAIQYRINVTKTSTVLSVFIILNVDGFSSRQYDDTTSNTNLNDPCFTQTSTYWATGVKIEQTPHLPLISSTYDCAMRPRKKALVLDFHHKCVKRRVLHIAIVCFESFG
ncbi:hypothetical protein BCR43DRAFT_514144 [Syncephalastrum racemosum]|uniref:Uncharacterized protein n=1 Tax=Syncephalastrum racemosum TaxID=13706 RepID=A0A1X2HFN2_SYNRA|nr:hypothetical protein BCR43DRAFT_514144 [Syncephalastrum racemosum]